MAADVLYPFTGWLLSPMIAALAMSLSSVFVIYECFAIEKLGTAHIEINLAALNDGAPLCEHRSARSEDA